jgi:hypothetical protein
MNAWVIALTFDPFLFPFSCLLFACACACFHLCSCAALVFAFALVHPPAVNPVLISRYTGLRYILRYAGFVAYTRSRSRQGYARALWHHDVKVFL